MMHFWKNMLNRLFTGPTIRTLLWPTPLSMPTQLLKQPMGTRSLYIFSIFIKPNLPFQFPINSIHLTLWYLFSLWKSLLFFKVFKPKSARNFAYFWKKLQWHTFFLHWLQNANVYYNYIQYQSNFVILIQCQLLLLNRLQTKDWICKQKNWMWRIINK